MDTKFKETNLSIAKCIKKENIFLKNYHDLNSFLLISNSSTLINLFESIASNGDFYKSCVHTFNKRYCEALQILG